MSPFSSQKLISILEEVYAKAKIHHNNLHLDEEVFMSQVIFIIQKHQESPTVASAVAVLKWLHTDDLYLTMACAQSIEAAWERLYALHRGFLTILAKRICGNRQQADEITQDTYTHLFLIDSTGKRRIASFQGLSSLSSWLAVVMQRRALDDIKSPFHQFEPIEVVIDFPDDQSTQRIEQASRSNRYSRIVNDSLRKACHRMNDRDRWVLLLRYEEGLPVKRIAETVHLKPQTITFHIQQALERLRKELYLILKIEHNLNENVLEECLEEVITSPAYSLLNLIAAV
jgi:RNA polymerase sigma factor (sigma-70 family)